MSDFAPITSFLYYDLIKVPHFLEEDFYLKHQNFFCEQHLRKFAKNLTDFYVRGIPDEPVSPNFYAECSPSLKESLRHFEGVLYEYFQGSDEASASLLAEAIQNAGCRHWLVLLGQRQTSATLTDYRGIPPIQHQLLQAASQIYKENLTVAGRAWTKHTQRSESKFWGKMKGTDQYKNFTGLNFIRDILDNMTWWNVFEHYKHEIVYEARIASGHGVRWGKGGSLLIGFLEPFLESEELLH